MNTLHRCVTLAIAIGLLASEESSAQIVKKAQAGFRFLENPVSAEAMGRGGLGVATTFTSNAIFWNPALLGTVSPTVDISVNHTEGIADINYNAIAACARLWDVGVVGFSLLAMDYGSFIGTMRAVNAQGYVETGEFSPKAIAVGVAFSQKVSDRFSYGIHLKYARQDLGTAMVSTGDSLNDPNLRLEGKEYVRGAYALDVGAYYDFLYNGIRFGATLQNISKEIRYENEAAPMPFAVSFGVTVEPLNLFFANDTAHSLLLSVESKHPRDFGEKVKVGAEYHFYDIFIARVGYATNCDERGWAVGFGMKQILTDVPLRVDYAYQPFGVLGAAHFISLGFSYE